MASITSNPPTDTDESDVLLAHKYRISLARAPRQSNFRVVALIFLDKQSVLSYPSDLPTPLVCWHHDRPFLLGTNAESCWMGNSLCAERVALSQLAWYPNARVKKVVISTDSPKAIAPGMLCREFMASCDAISWETPIILGSTLCQSCRKYKYGHEENESSCDQHRYCAFVSNLLNLYPHPSLYVRSPPLDCIAFGAKWKSRLKEFSEVHKLLEVCRSAKYEKADDNLHPISYVAAVQFRDKSIATARSVKSLEYGCSLDAVTQLTPVMTEKRRQGLEATRLVQMDQFGLCHAPFAPGRAMLVEQGFGGVTVWMHSYDLEDDNLVWKTCDAADLAPLEPDFVDEQETTSGNKSP